jgi:ABC-type branched-subunit amino acid transport system ATPase component
MRNKSLLDVAGLCAGYGSTPVLQGIDLTVGPGEIVSVIGRNGVGKTTMMRALIGLIRASAGSIRFGGLQLAGELPERRAQAGIGSKSFRRQQLSALLTAPEITGSFSMRLLTGRSSTSFTLPNI